MLIMLHQPCHHITCAAPLSLITTPFTQGIGEARFLNISHEQQPPDTNVPNDLRLKAKSIWDACQVSTFSVCSPMHCLTYGRQ